MKMKILCLIISLIIFITFTACGLNQTMTQLDDENHNTAPSDTVTTPSYEVTTPYSEVTRPSSEVAIPTIDVTMPSVVVSDTISDAFIASCNKNSGGYINYLNGKYYYRNTEGDKLFMCDADGKNAVCIDNCTNATLSRITVDETAVYYLKQAKLDTPLEFHNYSVSYSVVFEGQLRRYCDGKVTVLSEENVVDYALSKDYIFYTVADRKVYRMKHDGTEKTAIIDSTYPNICASENKLYTHMGEGVCSTDFDGKNRLIVRAYHFELAASESAVYFISADDCSLNKMSLNGETIHKVISDPIRSFTVYNGRLVYERMQTNDIVIADMDGKNPKVLGPGADPIALNGHLFYLDNGVIKVADV